MPATEKWEDVILRGKHLRDIETKDPIPYREVAKSVSFGNKWVKCWTSEQDIKNYPAENLEYLDESEPLSTPVEEGWVKVEDGKPNLGTKYWIHIQYSGVAGNKGVVDVGFVDKEGKWCNIDSRWRFIYPVTHFKEYSTPKPPTT